jgi:hypothetical protein
MSRGLLNNDSGEVSPLVMGSDVGLVPSSDDVTIDGYVALMEWWLAQKQKYLDGNPPQCHFVHYKSPPVVLLHVLNPGFRGGEKSSPKRLMHSEGFGLWLH